MRPRATPFVRMQGSSENFLEGQIIDTKSGTAISFDDLINEMGSKDLVFIGEIHDNPEHHLIQVQVLQALLERHGPLDIGVEFFEKPQQPIIDRYLEGDVEEEEFLDLTAWVKTWAFDYNFYRPLFLEIKYSKNRIFAINAPRKIVRKIARTGIASLSDDERGQIAEHIDLDNKEHRGYVLEAYKIHAHKDLKKFDFFYQAQCVWEDTMAESIAAHIESSGKKIVVFSGNGHVIYKFGIPERTFKRIRKPFATLILQPAINKETIDPEAADFVWLTGNYQGRPHFMQKLR